jgi:hypothetical protein
MDLPFKFAPQVRMGIGNEDGCEGPKSTNDGKSEELVGTSQSVLAKAAKIGHVDSQRTEKPNDDIESRERRVRCIHVTGLNF